MAKPKVNFKELMLKKGEYIALGVAGFVLLLLLIGGVTTMAEAEDPDATIKELTSKSKQVHTNIATGTQDPAPLPEWVAGRDNKVNAYAKVPGQDFATQGRFFDPTAQPSTKRENPNVLGVTEYRVDLVRAPMPGYDIIEDDARGALIAVKVTKKLEGQDRQKAADALNELRKKGKQGVEKYKTFKNQPGGGGKAPGGGGMPPGLGPPPGGGMGSGGSQGPPPGGGGSAGGPPPGLGGMGGPGGDFGPSGGGFDANSQRTDTFVTYIPLDDLDKAMKGEEPYKQPMLPAMTVIPLRMAVINASFPLKAQLEEVKRAMRLKNTSDAFPFTHFDGFDVRRKVSRIGPDGQPVVVQDWADYPYLDKYIGLLDSRKMADHLDVLEGKPRTQYLPYFIRYEEGLVMPLPHLVAELGAYPDITDPVNRDKLPSINNTIDKLIAANTQKVSASDLAGRLKGAKPTGKRGDLLRPQGGDQSKAFGYDGGPSLGMGSGKGIDPTKGGGDKGPQQMIEIDNLLVRFIDPDVRPGLTYEYQIRVRLENPNWDKPETVANKAWATEEKYKVLPGKWIPLDQPLTVPYEAFLYAADRAAYYEQIERMGSERAVKPLRDRLQVKDNQAVIQLQTWMEEVKLDDKKREPVGGWVVAEFPVSRGEYIGRKTYVRLPLWSSKDTAYILREVPDKVIPPSPTNKNPEQPKGWLVDFSRGQGQSILVDFEGGKVKTPASNNRIITEDAATEVLILRSDGRLMVRNSESDDQDATRKYYGSIWDRWLKEVEQRKPTGGDSTTGEFDRKN